MSRIDDWIDEWAFHIVMNLHKSDFYGINVVEKILRDPGISTNGGRSKILWWPPRDRRVAKISRAMHQIDPISRVCLIIDTENLRDRDGKIFDKYALAKNSSVTVRRFNELTKNAKTKLRRITKT